MEVDTDPIPTVAVPPTAEHISSFLSCIRQSAADGATATAASAAAVLAVSPFSDMIADNATAIAASAADTGMGVDTDPTYIDTALPAADATTAAAAGAAPTAITSTAVTGVTKKQRIKHNHAAPDDATATAAPAAAMLAAPPPLM